MSVAVLIPYRPAGQDRASALRWVLEQHARNGWPVILGTCPPGPWCKALAIADALDMTDADIVITADADCFTAGLPAAVDAVQDGAAWAMPHQDVHRLTAAGTMALLGGGAWEEQDLAERPYTGIDGGGFIVTRRETLIDVPLDPRYVGWGQEDLSHSFALDTLAGLRWRGSAPLVHLFHEPQPRMTRRRGSTASWDLHRRYNAARNDPAAMRVLIEEAKQEVHSDARDAAEPAVHDYPPARR